MRVRRERTLAASSSRLARRELIDDDGVALEGGMDGFTGVEMLVVLEETTLGADDGTAMAVLDAPMGRMGGLAGATIGTAGGGSSTRGSSWTATTADSF